jgi:beta-glucosidase
LNLKGFDKVYLQPGQSQTVSFPITNQTLQNYSERREGWVVSPGLYTLAIGSSSADLHSAVSF